MRFKIIVQNIKWMLIFGIILPLASVTACVDGSSLSEPPAEKEWTIMYYGDGDCNLEDDLLADVREMKSGIIDGQGVNVIVLFDRISGYSSDSSTFGEDFTDTRLYRITAGRAWRISGSAQFPEITKNSSYEANVGDASTLKKFIEFCKANYPAKNYSLILSNHGGGAMKKKSYADLSVSEMSSSILKDICYDDTDGGDFLYTAEIGETLTSSESVQLFGLDACLMSSVEFAYQFRNEAGNAGFKAEIMTASAPLETTFGWDYEAILRRLQAGGGDNGTPDTTLGGNELYYDPAALTARQLAAIIVEEQRDSTAFDTSQSLTCLDLSKIGAVKTAVDVMASALDSADEKSDAEILRGNALTANTLHYFNAANINDWVFSPFFDLYNLADVITGCADLASIQDEAAAVRDAVDELVIYSFANSYYTDFIPGKSGVHIFFPDGDKQITKDVTDDAIANPVPVNLWWWQDWYNALDISGEYAGAPKGKLAWCLDGSTANDSTVQNWFELLDKWYDTQTIGSNSNFNYYSY